MYRVLAFTVWTGGDDLRANSYVEADLHFPDGTTTTCDLRPDNDSWDNNTAHSAPPCALPAAKRFADLKAIKIDLVYDGDAHAAANHYRSIEDAAMNFDTWDNWDVNQVRIIAQNPGQHQQICLLDVTGNPLVRMKGNNYTFRLTDAMSSC